MKIIILFSDMFTQRKDKGEFRAFLLNYLLKLQSYCEVTILTYIWDKLLKSGLSKFFKDCLPQNLLSPLLNTLSRLHCVFPIWKNIESVVL